MYETLIITREQDPFSQALIYLVEPLKTTVGVIDFRMVVHKEPVAYKELILSSYNNCSSCVNHRINSAT